MSAGEAQMKRAGWTICPKCNQRGIPPYNWDWGEKCQRFALVVNSDGKIFCLSAWIPCQKTLNGTCTAIEDSQVQDIYMNSLRSGDSGHI
tara:strand:- start:53596 stop:53865 length:270 start_codon:yes stop_codon:yes gene_type:complete